MSAKGAMKKYGVSILLTLVIIGIVFLIGPAAALILSIDGLVVGPGTVTFNLNFDIGPGELIPGGFTVNINGDTCQFDQDANPIGGSLCPQIDCEVLEKSSSMFGQFNANGFFDGYGYGYGYRYGYGYQNGELRYRCTWRGPCAQAGTLTIFFTTTVDGMDFSSAAQMVDLIPQPCGGTNSGGGGGGQGYCCDPVVNFAKWRCCQKAYIARIQCCAQPQHPDCSRYCKLMECIKPYVMDPIAGRCIMPSQNEPGVNTFGSDGSQGGSTGHATNMGGNGGSGGSGGQSGGSSEGDSDGMGAGTILAIILALLGLGLLAYFLSRRS